MPIYESQRKSHALSQVRGIQSNEQRFEAPIGGLNTLDSIDNVPSTDAIILDNLIPSPGAVRVRGGFVEYADLSESGDVKTLIQYHDQDKRHFLAICTDSIFDITDPNSISSLHTFTDGDPDSPFDYAIIENESSELPGQMAIVNGSCTPVKYNGTAVTALSVSGTHIPVSTGTPLDPMTLIGVHSFKNRLYYWESNSQNFWYTDLYSVQGTLTEFPLGATGNYGGKLIGIETWTRDGGSGPDDFIVFFMSGGDAIVYQGYSPEDTYNWAIVGRYHIGEPVSNRAIVKVGGDIIVTTQLGYISLNAVTQGTEAQSQERKIDGAFKQAISLSDTFGWESVSYASEKIIIFSYPIPNGFEQHVMNIGTQAWCKFKNITASTFCVFDNQLYHGGSSGKVYKTLYGNNDDGESIRADLQTAWVAPSNLLPKTFIGFKPIFRANAKVVFEANFETDYDVIPLPGYPAQVDPESTPWSAEDYLTGGVPITYWTDEGSGSGVTTYWSAQFAAVSQWELIEGDGSVISMHMRLNTLQFVEFLGYKYLTEMSERL